MAGAAGHMTLAVRGAASTPLSESLLVTWSLNWEPGGACSLEQLGGATWQRVPGSGHFRFRQSGPPTPLPKGLAAQPEQHCTAEVQAQYTSPIYARGFT